MFSLVLFACTYLPLFGFGSPVASQTASATTNVNSTIFDFFAATTSTSDTCTDISICRTRYTIIWSSLVTILACVWTAVHRNVPEPESDGESRFWRMMGQVWEAAKIVVVTVLAPEWVLAWAVRQWLNARRVVKELEWARGGGKAEMPTWIKRKRKDRLQYQKIRVEMTKNKKGDGTQEENVSTQLAAARRSGEKLEGEQQMFNIADVNKQTGRVDGKWTARHGFFVIMGGFHFYVAGKPQHPLSRDDVVLLIMSGELVPPTDEEIRKWSQSDVLSKTLAVVQTLWFVVQVIARRIEGLPITQLEIMTLAYTVITVAMYVAWWDKPQNVGGPVRVAVKQLPWLEEVTGEEWHRRISYIITGWLDDGVDLRKERRVPTFYSGSTSGRMTTFLADIVALCAAMAFGAVHCAAWHYAFPSDAEKLIWRVSSLAIVALPAATLASLMLLLVVPSCFSYPKSILLAKVFGFVWMLVFVVSAPLYIAARALLLALSFSSLRSLPPEAYRAVQWTLQIPHFT
ncbi:hypothetical protein BV25DRAFT_1918174 [Artomyces pyxidatus]|uniref:Uncharacterized protein n=1 Tax=Artomyces pyxidatus TaxID=48021 RepID=A0ACB8STF5_9AGAM|nr:hypothetical protein BV25DRAFT_1918174 [Artomyces pyxidatus]